jgi:hypothetical protein
VTDLSIKICVYTRTNDLCWKNLYIGRSPNKIKSYMILCHVIWKVQSVLWKSLLPQILGWIPTMKILSKYTIYYVKNKSTVHWTVLCVAAAAVLVTMTHIYMCHVCVLNASRCVACWWQLCFICTINCFCVEQITLLMDTLQYIINLLALEFDI